MTNKYLPKLFSRHFFSQRGFTLLETLVAVFIITVAIAGVFVLISQIISLIHFSSSKIIAAYLAQEGIEIIKNIRDNNYLTGTVAWDSNLPEGEFALDYTTQGLPDSDCLLGDFLKIDGGFYNCTTGLPSKFKRKVIISQKEDLSSPPDGEPDSMRVEVIVEWQERGNTYQISVIGQIYNWLQ